MKLIELTPILRTQDLKGLWNSIPVSFCVGADGGLRMVVNRILWYSFFTLVVFCIASCGRSENSQKAEAPDLTGAWRAKVQFQSGAFASVKDLEFMYVFNSGGTMTESSNYDAAPPVPPAYGIWRRVSANQFEAVYEFYTTASAVVNTPSANGWVPSGKGKLMESITLSKDGNSYTSTIRYEAFDQSGKAVEGGGTATGKGVKLKF